MKLLVMGAGYVGMALLAHLRSQPHEIFITTTQEGRVESLRAFGNDVLVLGANEDNDLEQLIDLCDGMVVLFAPKKGQNYEETYLNTAKRISSVLKGRKRPFYLLYTSSTSVCEGQRNGWVTEDMPLDPKSDNGKILLETERLYLSCGVSACVLRLGGIYGPNRNMFDRARRLSGKEMPGTGEEPTNSIHLEDIVEGIIFCLDHALTGVYQLVSDDHRSRNELYSMLCNSLNIPPPVWNPGLQSYSKGGHIVSNDKIKQAGFTFKHPAVEIEPVEQEF